MSTIRDVVEVIYKIRASQAVQGLKKIVTGTKEVDAAQRGLKNELGGLGAVVGQVAGQATKMVSGFMGVQLVRSTIQGLVADIELLAKSSRSMTDQMVDLMSLDPQMATANVNLAISSAKVAGRDIGDTSGALHDFLSATGHLDRKDQLELFKEVTEATAISGSGSSIGEIAQLFGTAQTISGEDDFQKIGNILRTAAVEGKLDTGKLARFLPRLIAPGKALGLDLAGTSGLFAAGSKLTGKPEEASTGIAAFMRTGLIDPAIRKRFGISANPVEAIEQLAARGGLDLEQAKVLAGGEGAAVLLGLVNEVEVMRQSIAAVRESAGSGTDRDEAEFAQLMRGDTKASRLFRARFTDVKSEIREEESLLDAQALINSANRRSIKAELRDTGASGPSLFIGGLASEVAEIAGAGPMVQAEIQAFGTSTSTLGAPLGTADAAMDIARQTIVNIHGDLVTGVKNSDARPPAESGAGRSGDEGGRP